MATKRGNVYYLKRQLPCVGKVYKSLQTRNAEGARVNRCVNVLGGFLPLLG